MGGWRDHGGGTEGATLTRITAGHDGDGRPCEGLEEVVRARDEGEAVPSWDRAFCRPFGAQVAQGQVRV